MKRIIMIAVIGLVMVGFSGCYKKILCEDCDENIVATREVPAPVTKQVAPVINECSVRQNLNVCEQDTLFRNNCDEVKHCDNYLEKESNMRISVIGQGVAPCTGTCSPAQSYAMAKRAAIADSYRLIAEKVKGVYVEGDDLVQNMMVKRSTVRTRVSAMVKNANIVETTFKDGLCEVEMEITIAHSQFAY